MNVLFATENNYIAQNIKNRIFFSTFSIVYFILAVITDFTNTFLRAGGETTFSKVNWGHDEHGCIKEGVREDVPLFCEA